MSVDIGGYYGATGNPYKYGRTYCFPYYQNINNIQDNKPNIEPAYKPHKKSIIPQIIASGISLIALIAGAIFLKKGAKIKIPKV